MSMEATHVLLGWPWQYDQKHLHDRHTNEISFNFHGRKIILRPFSPKEVNEDQVKMKIKREIENGENNKVKTGLIISPPRSKTVMLSRLKINTTYPRYSLSLSFPSTDNSKYVKCLLETIGDVFQNSSKGLHIIRGISHQIPLIPKHYLQTRHVSRTNPHALKDNYI